MLGACWGLADPAQSTACPRKSHTTTYRVHISSSYALSSYRLSGKVDKAASLHELSIVVVLTLVVPNMYHTQYRCGPDWGIIVLIENYLLCLRNL